MDFHDDRLVDDALGLAFAALDGARLGQRDFHADPEM